MKKINVIKELHVMGRGTILVVTKDDYQKANCHINDIINNEYVISGVEHSPHGKFVGLIVRKFMEELGKIFYNYDAIDITHHVYSDLFKETVFLNQGAESLVYDAGDYVYKIKKIGYVDVEDIHKQISGIKKKNKIPIFLEEEPIGILTHTLESSVKHLVTKQKKIFPLVTGHNTPTILAFIKQGWTPLTTSYEKDGLVVYDIRPENCGLDEDGNFKIIDCMAYTK